MQRVADVKPSSASQPVSESTFADLLKPLIEPGFRLALAMLNDVQAAEDAVQEASFTAWRKLGRMQDQGRLLGSAKSSSPARRACSTAGFRSPSNVRLRRRGGGRRSSRRRTARALSD